MTKSELIAKLSERFPSLVLADCDAAVSTILATITQSLSKDDRVEIRGFGSFSLGYRAARQGRNPKSGESVVVSEHYMPRFKAGRNLRERVDAAASRLTVSLP